MPMRLIGIKKHEYKLDGSVRFICVWYPGRLYSKESLEYVKRNFADKLEAYVSALRRDSQTDHEWLMHCVPALASITAIEDNDKDDKGARKEQEEKENKVEQL